MSVDTKCDTKFGIGIREFVVICTRSDNVFRTEKSLKSKSIVFKMFDL